MVTIGHGSDIVGRGTCKKIEVILPELVIQVDFLAMELGKMDVILGMPWLCSAGFMGVHWPSKSIAFMAGNRTIILKGDPFLTTAECSLKTITKTWENEDQGFLIEFQNWKFKRKKGKSLIAKKRRKEKKTSL